MYTLACPNREVEASLNANLVFAYGADDAPAFDSRVQLVEALQAGDLARVKAAFHALFASIPHDWYRNNPLASYEGHYASVFYSHLAALGLDTRVEDATNKGNIDLALRVGERVYLFEFKVVEQAPAEQAPAKPGREGRALAQLREKGYAEKYRARGVTVTPVGIEFGKAERNLVGFEVGEG